MNLASDVITIATKGAGKVAMTGAKAGVKAATKVVVKTGVK